MNRFSYRALLAALLASAAGAAAFAQDTTTTLDYFSPVTYQMTITRPGAQSGDATRDKSDLAFELFDNRTLLRLILGPETSLKKWSLVAQANSADFETETLGSFTLVARHRSGEVRPLPEGMSFELVLGTSVQTGSETREGTGTEVGDRISAATNLGQLASLEQNIPARGASGAAGRLEADGYVTHGTAFATLSGDAADAGAVLRPTGGSYRASGFFYEAGDEIADGMVELLITFGRPTIVPVTAAPPPPP